MNFIKKNKVVLIILSLVLIYGIIMIFVLKNDNKTNNNNSSNNKTNINYLLINNISNWSYSNDKWNSLTNKEVAEANATYKAFVNNNYLGEYKVLYGTKWNLIDNDNNIVVYNGNLIAYSTNFNINISHLSSRKINSDDEKLIKEQYSFANLSDLTDNEVYDVDLDNNGTKDEVICLSNVGSTSSLTSYFNLLIIKYNDDIKTLISENIKPEDMLDSKTYYISLISNINDSDISSIIVGYKYGSEAGKPGNMLFSYENNNFNKVYSD